jgi:hypothetical protein
MKAGGDCFADIRRVHDDECKQARNRQSNNQFEETTEQERAEVHCANNKKTVGGIPESLTVAILAHTCP